MTISIILVALGFLALLFFIKLTKGHAISPAVLENPSEHIRSVDLQAFRNLIDPEQEDYLRRRLDPSDFRRIQRERLGAAIEYVRGAAHNASVLLALAESARHSPDPAIAANAQKLIDNAIRLRLYAFQTIPKLYLAILLPGRRLSPGRVADRYEQMTRQVVALGLRYPMRGVSAVL
jgi:hypothetical protein